MIDIKFLLDNVAKIIEKEFLLDHIEEIAVIGGAIGTAIGMAIKIKLDKMNSYSREYYPTVERYIKSFKLHQSKMTEELKRNNPNNNKKGF